MEFVSPVNIALVAMPIVSAIVLISLPVMGWYSVRQERKLMQEFRLRHSEAVENVEH